MEDPLATADLPFFCARCVLVGPNCSKNVRSVPENRNRQTENGIICQEYDLGRCLGRPKWGHALFFGWWVELLSRNGVVGQ